MPHHPLIDKHKDFIISHLETNTIFWIGKQIGLDRCTMYRYAKLYGWKGIDYRVALSVSCTPSMLSKLYRDFPKKFNRELAAELGVSVRTLIRKARELGINKEPDFLDRNREVISRMAAIGQLNNIEYQKGRNERLIEAGKKTRFKKGQRPMQIDRKKMVQTRRKNEERLRYFLRNPY